MSRQNGKGKKYGTSVIMVRSVEQRTLVEAMPGIRPHQTLESSGFASQKRWHDGRVHNARDARNHPSAIDLITRGVENPLRRLDPKLLSKYRMR